MIVPVILTRGRADNQITLSELPRTMQALTQLVVYPEEYEDHKERFGNICNVISTPHGVRGIAARREWVAHNFRGNILFMMDDDITFCRAKEDNMWDWPFVKFGPMDKEDWVEAVKDITTGCDLGFRVGGFGQRIAPAGIDSFPAALNSRVYTNTYFDFRNGALDPSSIDWIGPDGEDGIFFPEDFHVQCQLVRQGEIVLNWNKYGTAGNKTQASGGCSAYRTTDNHNRGMQKFAEVWSDCTTLRWKDGWEANTKKAALTIRLDKLNDMTRAEKFAKEDELRSALGVMSKASAKDAQARANKIREETQKNGQV